MCVCVCVCVCVCCGGGGGFVMTNLCKLISCVLMSVVFNVTMKCKRLRLISKRVL